jgi:hypothetical protein
MPYAFPSGKNAAKFVGQTPGLRVRYGRSSLHQAAVTLEEPARGPAADEGVRPTVYAGA